MRKLTVAACAAGVLATAILGLAGPAAAAVPPAPLARCTWATQGQTSTWIGADRRDHLECWPIRCQWNPSTGRVVRTSTFWRRVRKSVAEVVARLRARSPRLRWLQAASSVRLFVCTLI